MTDLSAEVARLNERVRQLEEALKLELAATAALTEPTKFGRPGFQWAAYHDGLEEDDLTPTSETSARRRVAGLRSFGIAPNPLLLRRAYGAWERWTLTAEEADEMAPTDVPDCPSSVSVDG